MGALSIHLLVCAVPPDPMMMLRAPGTGLSVLITLLILSMIQGVVRSCDPYKFYYYDEVFDSAYVLKDSDSSILNSCSDECVYTKVGEDSFNEFCFAETADQLADSTTEYTVPCSTRLATTGPVSRLTDS